MKKLKFTEIKPYNFVLKIKKIIQGFKNLIIYLPVIWKDRDFDYYFTLELLHFKLKKQWKFFEENGYIDYGVQKLRVCINLLEKVKEDYYFEEAYNLTVKGCKRKILEYLHENRNNLKKMGISYDENTPIGTLYYITMMLHEYKQKKAERLFFELFRRYYKTWWI